MKSKIKFIIYWGGVLCIVGGIVATLILTGIAFAFPFSVPIALVIIPIAILIWNEFFKKETKVEPERNSYVVGGDIVGGDKIDGGDKIGRDKITYIHINGKQGREKEDEKEKSPLKPSLGTEKKKPFNSKLVDTYVNMLRTKEYSSETACSLLQTIRYEVIKVYSTGKVDKEDLKTIENLLRFTSKFIKNKDEKITLNILFIWYLLTKAPEASQLVKKMCYDYLKELYETGKRYDKLLEILLACGYIKDKDIPSKIMSVIDDKDEKSLDVLIGELENIGLTTIKDKEDILKNLHSKKDKLDTKEDTGIINKIDCLINQLEHQFGRSA